MSNKPVDSDIPISVLLRMFSRNKSPELIDASCGYLLISLSVWVPFPTPGAPTRMIRAAFLNRLVAALAPAIMYSGKSREMQGYLSAKGMHESNMQVEEPWLQRRENSNN